MNIKAFDQCANCGACVNACARKAITVESDGAFYSLVVDQDICTDCGVCVNVCPLRTEPQAYEVKSAWWGKHQDDGVVKKSSSGGAFSAIAEYVLKQNGVVFGACFDDRYQTVAIKNTEQVSFDSLRKSKYVESLVGESFREAKRYLQEGRMVLFCGTPCQIAGLRRFLSKEYEHLFTCDFSCGGVSSHEMYQAHLASLRQAYRSEISNVDFRPKTYGWSIYAIRVDFQNRRTYTMPAHLDPYCYGFVVEHINTRDYCYDCRFEEHHESDIILADFWKYTALTGKKQDKSGISLVLVNSEKGERLLKAMKPYFEMEPLRLEDGCYNIRKRTYSKEYLDKCRRFVEIYKSNGLKEANKAMGYTPHMIKTVMTKWWYRLKGLTEE